MKKMITDHLKRVTVENLEEFKQTAFVLFASASNKNGHFEIGLSGLSRYIVKHNDRVFAFMNAQDAVSVYHKLMLETP
jgi:hypothetical protein